MPFAEAVMVDAGIATMAVNLITGARQAQDIVRAGRADMVALGRELLVDQNWAHKARAKLEGSGYAAWLAQYGWWLEKRPAVIDKSTAP